MAVDALRMPFFSSSHPRGHMFRKINLILDLPAKGNSGSGDGQLRGPARIAVDESGNDYVVDQTNHRVQVFKGW